MKAILPVVNTKNPQQFHTSCLPRCRSRSTLKNIYKKRRLKCHVDVWLRPVLNKARTQKSTSTYKATIAETVNVLLFQKLANGAVADEADVCD